MRYFSVFSCFLAESRFAFLLELLQHILIARSPVLRLSLRTRPNRT